MSDSSTAAFTELKDDTAGSKKDVSIPINAGTTTTAKPPPPSTAAPTAADSYSSLFQSTSLPPYSFDWFMFYLKQTRVLVILAHIVLFLVLVIWIASIGKSPAITSTVTGAGDCSEWQRSEVIPDVISVCPPSVAQIFYPSVNGRVVTMGSTLVSEAAAVQPSAIFVPGATASGYYTAIFVHPDSPSRSNPTNRNSLKGIILNMKLTESISTLEGEWVVPYSAVTPNIDTGEHRYVWLIYRHSGRLTNVPTPTNLFRFDVEKWIAENWTQKPQLVAGQTTTHAHCTHTLTSSTPHTRSPSHVSLSRASVPLPCCSQLLHLAWLRGRQSSLVPFRHSSPPWHPPPASLRLVSPHALSFIALLILAAPWGSLPFPILFILSYLYRLL